MPGTSNPHRLPGAWLTAIARILFDDSVLEQVLQPTIVDLQNEWIEAGDDPRARRLARVRGYVAFWSLVFMAPVAFRNWTNQNSDAGGFFQRVWRFEMTMATRIRFTTLLVALGLGVGYAASYVPPVLYISTAVLQVQPSQTTPDPRDSASIPRPVEERLRFISQVAVSRTRLEQIIDELGLFKKEGLAIQEAVSLMRQRLAFMPSARGAGQFTVSFVDPDPRMSMRVAERVAAIFIDEDMKEHEQAAMRRRQIGERFILLEAAQLPTHPIGPNRLKFTIAGGTAGLAAAVLFMLVGFVWRTLRERRLLKPTTA